ncbi:MAG: hotdog fold thioesterase [Candidatus Mycalebacterium zealandia]|nr:MAG: hotdog fold thioesterase [Candidatus Mycalebacterium zealandia]
MSNEVEKVRERMERVPIMKLLGAQIARLEKGLCELTAPKKENYDGIFETFHGGLLTTVADTAAAAAVLTVAGSKAAITTTDINIRFLNPCLSGVTAVAKVIKAGKTLCPVQVELTDSGGKTVSIAQVTYMVLNTG